MVEVKVLINTIEKVKDFSNICSKQSFDIDLISERYVVDAKSIMAIFSLNLVDTMTLRIHTDSDKAKSFIDDIHKIYIKPTCE